MSRLFRCFGVALLLLGLSACNPAPPTPPAPAPEPKMAPAPPPPLPPKPAPPVAQWETYHGPASLAGAADVTLPETLTQVWKYEAGAGLSNTPVVGKDRVCFADNKGVVHALDLNGQKVWSKAYAYPAPEGRNPITVDFYAPLAVFESTLLACSAAGTVYAVDVTTGDPKWERNTEYPIQGTPNVTSVTVDGAEQKRLYVIDESEGALQCLDFTNGNILWRSKSVARCDGSPAVSGSFAVYGSCAGAVHVFSTVNGDLLREIHLDEDSQIAGGVVLLGDSVYSGSRSGKFIHANVQTAETVWTNTDCEGESFSTPAVNNDTIVYGANDSTLYALDRATGKLKWKQKMPDTPTSPVIAGDKIAVTADGALYLISLADGHTLWSQPVSDEVTSPALAGALVIVGGDDGSVTAFGSKPGG